MGTVGDVAGINGVEWDAVELPSQFMENWCYDKETVYGFAKHYETGEPLPEDKFEKLKEQKTFNAGMMACRQLLFGMLDMELHANFDAKAAGDEKEKVSLTFTNVWHLSTHLTLCHWTRIDSYARLDTFLVVDTPLATILTNGLKLCQQMPLVHSKM